MQATQQTQNPVAVIDATPNQVTKEELLDLIAETKTLLKQVLATLP